MKTLEELQKLSLEELKDFLKQNHNHVDFLAILADDFDEVLALLFKVKFFSKEINQKILQVNLSKFLKQAIANDFCPSIDMVEELLNQSEINETLLQELIAKFPTLPLTMQFLMRLINLKVSSVAVSVFLSKKEFQKSELLRLMVKNNLKDDRMENLIIEDEENREQMIKDLSSGKNTDLYPFTWVNSLIQKHSLPKSFNYDYLMKNFGELNFTNQETVIDGYIFTKKTKENNKVEVVYHENFEKMEDRVFYSAIVTGAPQGSKFRFKSVLHNPSLAENLEFLEITKVVSRWPRNVAINVLSRGLDFVKQNNLDKIEETLTPSEVADNIRGEQNDLRLFLYENLSSKYKPALYKTIPLDLIPDSKSVRKKSYFFEAFDALKRKNVPFFQEALSHGYSVEDFARDSFQDSKQRSCELTNISSEMIPLFTKSELLFLIKTPLSFRGVCADEVVLPYKLTPSEAYATKQKFSIEFGYRNCESPLSFLNYEELDAEDLSSIYRYFMEDINRSPKLLSAYLSRSKASGELELNDDMVKSLCSILTFDEIKKLGKVESYYRSECLSFKTVDGKFYLTDEEVLSMLSERTTIESIGFLENLYLRDPILTQKVIDAYLEGNKGLSALAGEKINIKRQQIDLYNKFKTSMNQNPEEIVEQIFSEGGLFSDFKERLLNFKKHLENFGKNRVLVVESADLEDLDEFVIPNTQLHIKELNILNKNSYQVLGSDFEFPQNIVKIDKAIIGPKGLEKDLDTIIQFLKEQNVSDSNVSISEDNPICVLRLAMKNSPWVQKEDALAPFLNSLEYIEQLDLDALMFLENHGLMFNDELVYKLLEHFISSAEIMEWLSSRIGGLNNYVLGESAVEDLEASELEALKAYNLNIIPDNKLALLNIENKIQMQGPEFSAVNIASFSLVDKHYLIKFIGNEVDIRYNQLDLLSSNLDSLEVLLPYDSMKRVYSLNEQDIIQQLSIPHNLISNKKVLKSLKDYMTLEGAGFIYKVDCLKQVVELINPQIELTLSDFVNYDNHQEVESSEGFNLISLEVLMKVLEFKHKIKQQNILLVNQKKPSILKFLRTCSEHGDDYVRDILNMINSVLNGLDGLQERAKALIEEGASEEMIVELNTSIASIENRLKEVSLMDDATHMHDRLNPLQSFIKSDPLQPLGQDKFKKIEKSCEKELGYQLYFPRTRGDLQFLGDKNGWCVNNSSHYGDNVINEGNILVGLCEKGTESDKENVIALAHFLHKGNNQFQLEQLKWSSRKKNGSRNVDATSSFNHGQIISLIKNHLLSYKKGS